MKYPQRLGAKYLGDEGAEFLVWAPDHDKVELHVMEPEERFFEMQRQAGGYHHLIARDLKPGALYMYKLGPNLERPDPASRYQPRGVHGPSAVTADDFNWTDGGWPGLDLEDYVIYELHIGTFTDEGDFDEAIRRLPELKELGITAVELIPVCQFPGNRNWGYDGVYPFSVHHDYGGPDGLKRFVDMCHGLGLAVIMDVVYNHLGPEGNYLADFGPYFTHKYGTPWGSAINFDSSHSDQVREYFCANAQMWIEDYHMDALRLDAVHGIFDFSAKHILKEIGERVHKKASELNRKVYVIPESDLNDSRLIRSHNVGGYDLDGQWNDDFHHALHALLTGERNGYYEDFGHISHLAKAFRSGFVYTGEYSVFRKRRHGNKSSELSGEKFVVFSQNHDQVGNRANSERLSELVSFEGLKMAAGLVLLSPFIPLIFMGEEYGETAPFPYFISHGDPDLIQAVREGRKREFQAFAWKGEPMDPYAQETFQAAKLNWDLKHQGHHALIHSFYKELIALRARLKDIFGYDREKLEALAWEQEGVLHVRRWNENVEAIYVFKFKGSGSGPFLPVKRGRWVKQIDSMDERWGGPGSVIPTQTENPAEIALQLKENSFAIFINE